SPRGPPPPAGRRRRNEPCLLPFIAQRLAELYRVPLDELVRHTTANARRFFRLDTPPQEDQQCSPPRSGR
ncbi:MAG: TatD family hydrolase, partial [Gammaproteobacteria bacterium]|nr:TatD family hydrolase [Gammaproteobacteria bacterium]